MFIPFTEVNYGNTAQQLAEGIAAIDAGQTVMAFSNTNNVNSGTVACMLAWKRHAQQRGVPLEFQHLPDNLNKLIALYGVAAFL